MRDYFLTTERLGFSIWKKEDIELAVSLWGDPEVTKHISAKGYFDRREIEDRLTLEVANYEAYHVQYFPIFEISSGELVGCCGLRPCIGEDSVFEIGLHLRKEYWGKGLGFEAALAIIDYASEEKQVSMLRAGHNPKNIASRNMLEKLGFQYEADYYYEPTGLSHPSYVLKK